MVMLTIKIVLHQKDYFQFRLKIRDIKTTIFPSKPSHSSSSSWTNRLQAVTKLSDPFLFYQEIFYFYSIAMRFEIIYALFATVAVALPRGGNQQVSFSFRRGPT